MNKRNILIMSLDEARDLVAGWFADVAVNDRQALYESILEGTPFIPRSIADWTPSQLAEQVGEMNLGEKAAVDNSRDGARVEAVLVQTGEYDYCLVWDIENIAPENREWVYAQHYERAIDALMRKPGS